MKLKSILNICSKIAICFTFLIFLNNQLLGQNNQLLGQKLRKYPPCEVHVCEKATFKEYNLYIGRTRPKHSKQIKVITSPWGKDLRGDFAGGYIMPYIIKKTRKEKRFRKVFLLNDSADCKYVNIECSRLKPEVELVHKIIEKLREKNYYNGPLMSTLHYELYHSILKFQSDNKLLIGAIGDDFLNELGIDFDIKKEYKEQYAYCEVTGDHTASFNELYLYTGIDKSQYTKSESILKKRAYNYTHIDRTVSIPSEYTTVIIVTDTLAEKRFRTMPYYQSSQMKGELTKFHYKNYTDTLLIEKISANLAEMNFYKGPVTKKFTAELYHSLLKFQADNKLLIGVIGDEVLSALGISEDAYLSEKIFNLN